MPENVASGGIHSPWRLRHNTAWAEVAEETQEDWRLLADRFMRHIASLGLKITDAETEK